MTVKQFWNNTMHPKDKECIAELEAQLSGARHEIETLKQQNQQLLQDYANSESLIEELKKRIVEAGRHSLHAHEELKKGIVEVEEMLRKILER